MINLSNVQKNYGKKVVLKGINLTFNENEAVAVVGSNGCGKTTLVELVANLIQPTEGEIVRQENLNIGMQFQDGSWPIGTKLSDLITFYKDKSYKKTEEFKKLVEAFDLEGIISRDISSLSGGQRQRINCFLSIINEPNVLILDELITGLDLEMQIKLISFFQNYKKEKKIILLIVSHIPEEVEALCDRVIILKDGTVYEDKNIEEITKEYGTLRKRLIKYYENEK
ncbi:peptide/nickel transport system ATP-binding protein [Spiroplasma chinense]|uniref:Peptide/nickel transport system ATP-binding protein n=1 Tax=Spiroplasma chinense TaxID=216932 RepID=A0A5B9Y5W9_9MOLU|nr:ABC transporter ATP-binding protein [Spiroplasma chinense]QEH62116.1 peptide/nickel transport system ATP-binding protein [Spiroplasma chinense]